MRGDKKRLFQGEDAVRYLCDVDPVLAEVIREISLEELTPSEDHFESPRNKLVYFYALVREIIGQQLSGKAADAIEKRFLALFSPGAFPNPEEILALSDEIIRNAGLSFSKISYIKNIARAVVEEKINFEEFDKLSDEEIITALITIKGVGRWTVEMFLMWTLLRPDVFSYGDLGLRKGMQKIYKLKKEPSAKRAAQISNRWKPHRSLACRYLWASLDNR